MNKLSETEKKVLMVWAVIGLLIFLCVVLINIKPKEKKEEPSITSPGTNHIIDRNRYYTVTGAINKYYAFRNAKNYDAVVKILSEKYVKDNNIDEDTVTTYIGENDVSISFEPGLMCLKSASDGVYEYLVNGKDVSMNKGTFIENAYYQVNLDGNTSLFSITPISKDIYEGECHE